MSRGLIFSFFVCSILASVSFGAQVWQENYSEKGKTCHFVSKGKNPYFVLEPGYALELDSDKGHEVLTVLYKTRIIDGVETRAVEDREMNKKGEFEEVTRDYYAICKETNTVYYFGEDVDVYKDGKVKSHEGAWLSGVQGAKYGIIMPGKPKLGMRYYEEKAPGVDKDRGDIVSLNESVKTPAGHFKHCMEIVGTNELEPSAEDHVQYAPGIGVVKDGDMRLVKYGYLGRK